MRAHARFALSCDVRVRFAPSESFRTLQLLNISRGGMFIRSEQLAPLGTVLEVELVAPAGTVLCLHAEVRHVVSPETAAVDSQTAGLGVRFVAPSADDQAGIDELCRCAQALAASPEERAACTATWPRDPGAVDDMERALRGRLGELREQDDFSVLGISYDATGVDVETSYQQLSERWKPGQYSGAPERIRELVAEIFIVVQGARARLADPVQRALQRERVLARGSSPAISVPARRRRKKDTLGELFHPEPAAASSPELVLARKLTAEQRYRDACEVLEEAMAERPDDQALRLQFRIAAGRAALHENEPETAAHHFTEALRIDPDCQEAIREMRRLSQRRRRVRREVIERLFGHKEWPQ
jgi:curved DNA-binding protein CbpA